MRDPARLEVWVKAIDLARSTYRLTTRFPNTEKYGLTSQSRRAAVSIAANIAEGYGRGSQKEFARFLRIAAGSAAELRTLLILAEELGIDPSREAAGLRQQVVEVSRMLNSLVRAIESRFE